MLTLAAVVLAIGASILATGGVRLASPDRRSGSLPLLPALTVAAVGAIGVAVAVAPGRSGMACIGIADGVAVAWIVRQGRRRRALEARSAEVVAACEALAGELAAGQPPARALRRVADGWPALHPVAEAARLGADVPSELRALATTPGLGRLRALAAAWQVSDRSGTGMTTSLQRTAEVLRADQRLVDLVVVELAAARTSARMLAALPAAALLISGSAGIDVESFFATAFGLLDLSVGSALLLLGLAWLERLARVPGAS